MDFFSIEKNGIFVNTSTFVSLVNLHTVFCVVLDVDLFGESIIGITVDTRGCKQPPAVFIVNQIRNSVAVVLMVPVLRQVKDVTPFVCT